MLVTRATLAALLIFASVAVVQAQVPGALLPGQIERQFEAAPTARSQAAPLSAPLKSQPMPQGAEQVRFRLDRIELAGTTVYAAGVFDGEYAPLLGREVSLADLYRLADKLTARYRNDGYILSQVIVPEQKVENGVARLQAVEGFIAEVRLVGVEYDWFELVAKMAEPIRTVRPLTADVLERQMLLINDLPGAFARAVLAPSASVFGAAELTIQFSEARAFGGLAANNRGGKLMGPMRYLADIEGINLLGLYDRTQARYVVSPNDELTYLSLQHELPVGASGGKVTLSVSEARAKPQEVAFIPLEIESRSTSLAVTYSHPLLRARSENLSLHATLSGHNDKTELLGFTESRDQLRVMRFGLNFDLADRWSGINLFDLEYSQGLNQLGASDNGDPDLSRAEGKVDFRKLSLYATRVQDLSARWSLLAAFNGQYTFDNLLAYELFSFGGESFGRGYDPSEMVGDHGAAGKFELRYAGIFDFAQPTNYTVYGFYDVGMVWQRPVQGISSRDSAASAGLGLRLGFGPAFSGNVEFAQPLTRDVLVEDNRHGRWYLGLSARF